MGGRGSAGEGRSGGGTRGHYERDFNPFSQAGAAAAVKRDPNLMYLQDEDATRIGMAITSYTRGSFEDIRAAQARGDDPNLEMNWAARAGVDMETFITMSQKWGSSGTLYRGIVVERDFLTAIEETVSFGGSMDMMGVSSWSSDYNVAYDFIAQKVKNNPDLVGITFNLGSTKKGASIKHLSLFQDENEVVISSKARFSPVHVSSSGYNIYDVEMVEEP